MLPHKDRRVGVVKKIPAKMGNLNYHLLGDFGMSLRRNQYRQSGGSEKRPDKLPGLWRVPWLCITRG